MSNDGSKLRDSMGRHLDELQPRTPIEQIRKRAHRGRLLMGTSLVALVALVGASGGFVIDRLADDDDRDGGGVVTAPSAEELIAFSTQDGNDAQPWIAVVPLRGGEVTRLHEGSDPSWSPDGTRIAFRCNRSICTMNADGSDVRRLTDPKDPGFDAAPDWGPNGWIAFARNYMDNPALLTARPRDVVLVAEDGSEEVTITTHTDGSDTDDAEPSWSPDGQSIAYIRSNSHHADQAPPGDWRLWTMNPQGGDTEMHTAIDGVGRPDWSPDGQWILFDRASALWTIPADGGEPRRLPVVSGQAFDVGSYAAWAPDSRRFAFMCSSKGTDNNDICLSRVDSDEWTVLVATNENESSPAWQPITDPGGTSPGTSPSPSPSPSGASPSPSGASPSPSGASPSPSGASQP